MIKPFSLIIMSWFYIYVGISHFTDPNWFLQIVPPYLPFKLELIYVSGFFEIIFGFMLILPSYRYYAGWGLVLLLIAVYPANIYLAQTNGAAMNTSALVACTHNFQVAPDANLDQCLYTRFAIT